MPIDPASLAIWINLGGQLVQLGTSSAAKIRAALDTTDETGNQLLDSAIADYDRRIAARETDAQTQD